MRSKKILATSIILIALFSLLQCNKKSETTDNSIEVAQADHPVEAKLKKQLEEDLKNVPPHILEAGRLGLKEMVESGLVNSALNVGDMMPSFELPDANGQMVKSDDLLADGSIVLVFYRGA